MSRKHFFLSNQPDALIIQICSVIKLYMFRASSLPIIRNFLLQITLVSFMQVFDNRFQTESGWNWLQFHPDSAWKRSSKTCTKLTSAEYTVENS